MKIALDEFRKIIIQIMIDNDASSADAQTVAEEIIYGQIRGKKSHGLPMLSAMVKRAQNKPGDIKLLKDSPQFAFIDGNNGIGPVVAKKAIDLCAKKTLEYSFSIVAVKNPSPFITAGYPAWYASSKYSLIAIDISVANSKVAPFGSGEAIFGTNPIGFAFPTETYPIVIDMSTTNIPAAKIRQAAEAGEAIPDNVALDSEGHFTTDPKKALDGALVTFGGYKGSAIALMIELMAGAFLNEKCGNSNGDMRTMLFFTCRPDLFVDTSSVLKNASNLRSEINRSKSVSISAPRTPGDTAEELMQDAISNGVELSEADQALLRKFGADL